MSVTTTIDTSPGQHPWPKETIHILFREQPKHYNVIAPAKLADWEATLKDILGAEAKASATQASWLPTTSFCGSKPDGDPNPCDCDTTTPVMLPPFGASSGDSSGPHDWPDGGLPVVFQRQPTAYEVVPPAQYSDWEAQILQELNLEMKAGGNAGYLPTLSWCSPTKTPPACDSDTIAS